MIKVIIYLGFALILVLLISFLYTISYENDKGILTAIESLREPIRNMGECNKKKSMKYVQNLSKLCILYYSPS